MLASLKKSLVYIFLATSIVLIVAIWWKDRKYSSKIVKLHNKIALTSETVEVHKNAYSKKTAELEDLQDVLKTFESENEKDKKTIRDLRKLIEDKDEDILSATRLVSKWKKAYEAEASANQTDVPDDDGDGVRKKVTFKKDFGYVGVEGFTLTDPAYAWVKIMQNRPLLLTMTLTQSKDGSWNTYVTTSEDNIDVDVKLSAVNPRILDKKWYEKLSVDVGFDVTTSHLYPYAGASYPVGPVSLSGGVWAGKDSDGSNVGWYGSMSYSWFPFSR